VIAQIWNLSEISDFLDPAHLQALPHQFK
jgi:hypothetical protein